VASRLAPPQRRSPWSHRPQPDILTLIEHDMGYSWESYCDSQYPCSSCMYYFDTRQLLPSSLPRKTLQNTNGQSPYERTGRFSSLKQERIRSSLISVSRSRCRASRLRVISMMSAPESMQTRESRSGCRRSYQYVLRCLAL
jgi:hypothetical protein